jgi:hypothetical protein
VRCPGDHLQDRRRGVRHGRHQRRGIRGEGRARPEGDRAQAALPRSCPCHRHSAGGADRLAGPIPVGPAEGRPVRPDPRRLGRRRPLRRSVRQGEGSARPYDCTTDNVEFARSLGADVVIDYKTQRFEERSAIFGSGRAGCPGVALLAFDLAAMYPRTGYLPYGIESDHAARALAAVHFGGCRPG